MATKNDAAGSLRGAGERGFLKRLLPRLAPEHASFFLVPPGDDAAVLKRPPHPVLSIDGLTEGTHFHSHWAPRLNRLNLSLGRALGWKAMGASLSDLAAMGDTRNRWSLVYVGTPASTPISFLMDLQRGLKEMAEANHCVLVGGDTVKARELSIVVAVGGDLVGHRPLTRSGARAGDFLCVAGTVGDAAIGLRILKGGQVPVRRADRAYFVKRFFRPQPMFTTARALSQNQSVTSLMDLSDPLGESIRLLAESSRVGADVQIDSVPVSDFYRRRRPKNASLLSGGEDYALLFTVKPGALESLKKKLPFSVIGRVTPMKQGLRFRLFGALIDPPSSFEHFSK